MPERFSASNVAKHMACHASADLARAIPNWVEPEQRLVLADGSTPANMRGSMMHEIFASMATLPVSDMRNLLDTLQYIADLRATRRFKVLSEESITAEWLVSKPKTTADLVLYTQDELHVLDLKTGKIEVPVEDNEQLMYYAVCYGPLAPKAKGVTLHILQPWAGGNHSWFASADRLKQFMDDAMSAEAAILAGSTKFGPSDHCKFCPANPHSRSEKGKPLCPTMMQLLYPKQVDEDAILALD